MSLRYNFFLLFFIVYFPFNLFVFLISQYFDRARQINSQPEYTNNNFTGLSVRKKPENLLKIQGGRQNKEKQSLS